MEIVRPFLVKKSPRTPEVIHSTSHFARYVGLSRSAVSRVLNNRRGLLPETVERVHRAMAETGFTPNAHARHLRGARTSVVGICIENFLTPTAISKLSALQQHLDACGYVAVTEVSRQGNGDKVVRHFRSLRVDGVIFVGHFQSKELDAWIGELTRHGTPHVVVDSSGLQSAQTVTIDRVAAMRVVMDHLLDLGHRRFALLGLSGGFQTVAERLRGVHEALVARRLKPKTCLRSLDDQHERMDHFEYGRTLTQNFLEGSSVPSAFVAVNDETAVGTVLELQAHGLRVPEDISVVGFNNQNICLMTRPGLTSVDQQIEATAERAVSTLLAQIDAEAPSAPGITLIEAKLVLRGSTGRAPSR